MVFFDNKHKVTQEIHALYDKCDSIRRDTAKLTELVAKLTKLILELSHVVNDSAELQALRNNDDEVLMAILARPTGDKTH